MSYAEVCGAVEALQKKYHESDPFRLCEDMNILLLSQTLGNAPDAIKGFYLESKRIRTITVNCCLLYTSPSPRDTERSRMPSSA